MYDEERPSERGEERTHEVDVEVVGVVDVGVKVRRFKDK